MASVSMYSESEAPSLNPAAADPVADAYVRVAGGPNLMVLSLPEILNHIFTFNSKASNLNCALVCKEWKDLALDHVWAELPGPKPFVLLLAPLVESDTVIEGRPSLVFQRDLRPADWDRVRQYARKVKVFFACRAKDNRLVAPHGMLSPSVFAEIARTRPISDIFPNLSRLVIYVEDRFLYWMQYAVLFLREGLKDMTMSFRPQTLATPFSQLENILEEVVSRSPRLTSFRMLTKNVPVAAYDLQLLQFLPSLRHLETFEFSPLCLTATVLEGLASLPFLKVIAGVTIKARKRGERPDLSHFNFKGLRLERETFAELRRFAIQGEPVSLNLFFDHSNHNHFPSLTSLNVDILEFEDVLHLKVLLQSVSSACPNLELLQLSRRELPDALIPNGIAMTAEVLEALPSIPNLEKFDCACFGDMQITDDELVDIISRCPSLRRIYLGYEPNSVFCTTTLTLKALHSLALQCPQITALGLHIDTSSSGIPSIPSVFHSLCALRVSFSPVTNKFEVAMFLSQLLSSPQILKTSNEAVDGTDALEETALTDVRQRKKDWEEVKQIMVDLERMRERDRASISALQMEIFNLQHQLALAMHTLATLQTAQQAIPIAMEVSDDEESS